MLFAPRPAVAPAVVAPAVVVVDLSVAHTQSNPLPSLAMSAPAPLITRARQRAADAELKAACAASAAAYLVPKVVKVVRVAVLGLERDVWHFLVDVDRLPGASTAILVEQLDRCKRRQPLQCYVDGLPVDAPCPPDFPCAKHFCGNIVVGCVESIAARDSDEEVELMDNEELVATFTACYSPYERARMLQYA